MSSTSDNGCDFATLEEEGLSDETGNEVATREEDNKCVDSLHPLTNIPSIIQHVLTYLTADEVETCRLVCREWNTEACVVLRTKRVVAFMDGDAVGVYINAMEGTPYNPHAQFEVCMELKNEKLLEFWNAFGPEVISLDIRSSAVTWPDFLDVIENRTPNLERLSLRFLPRQDPRAKIELDLRNPFTNVTQLRLASMPLSVQGTNGVVERLADLLKLLPNLQVIGFLRIKSPGMQARVSQTLVEAIGKPEVNLGSLTYIKLCLLGLTSDQLDALALKSLPLERLEMTLAEGMRASSLKNFLVSIRKTLTDLKITFPEKFTNMQTFLNLNDSMRPDESVQVLSNLKSLTMNKFKGSIYFAYKLPNLTKLIYTTDTLRNSIPMGFRRRPYGGHIEDHNLQALTVTALSCLPDTSTLNGISLCFPYLKSLTMHNMDDDGLGVIYRGLPLLSELILDSSTCTDQGLTGVPTEICIDMVETDIFTVAKVELYRQDLFIGSLPSLRTFSVTAPNISDAAVAFGMAWCKNLQELRIGSPLVTDKGIIFLANRLYQDLNLLDLTKCSNITEEGKFYAHEKLIGKVIVAEPEEEEADEMEISRRKMKIPKLEYTDRGVVKTKQGTSSSSRMASPDINFFEEIDTEHVHHLAHQLHLADHNPDVNPLVRVHAYRRFENHLQQVYHYQQD
ncbi:unnamed protein product [Orchesella dallaii]|uniref:F-box domain-containing protein n=1 Tax=Orchesella dallaii TaxID=48710 RepID=A0ABP1PMR8_9HEXA